MRKYINKYLFLVVVFTVAISIAGCANQTVSIGDSFASMFYNTTDSEHCYRSLSGNTAILDYESMDTSLLCNKPNCSHNGDDCIEHRLNGNVPMFNGTSAYYFVDDTPNILQGDDGKPFLKLGSTLYRFDLSTNAEEKLLYIDGVSVSDNCYGWLLHDGIIYFIGNHYHPHTDENGIMTSYSNTGGKMELYSVDLSSHKIQNYGDLYNVPELSRYYPYTPNSGEVYMRGIFDGKIYFNVAFVANEDTDYTHYVTWFDLNSKTYYGEPEDYGNIDFSSAAFVSKDYLVLIQDGMASVYQAGTEHPIILQNERFNMYSFISVFDDMLYCEDQVIDLNTSDIHILSSMMGKSVIAKVGDNFIISNIGKQDGFDKIPVSQLSSSIDN